jgi:hypothetical protein
VSRHRHTSTTPTAFSGLVALLLRVFCVTLNRYRLIFWRFILIFPYKDSAPGGMPEAEFHV